MTSRRDLESRINDLSGRSSIEDISDGELWDAYQTTVSPGEPNPVNGSEAYIEMLKRGEERKQ